MRSIAILLPLLYLLIAPARQQGCLNVLQAPSDKEELETGTSHFTQDPSPSLRRANRVAMSATMSRSRKTGSLPVLKFPSVTVTLLSHYLYQKLQRSPRSRLHHHFHYQWWWIYCRPLHLGGCRLDHLPLTLHCEQSR